MENSRRRIHRFSPGVASFTGVALDFKSERVNRAYILTTCGRSYHSPFSEKATKGCHTFLHGEAILLAPLFPHSPFSKNPFSDLREGVTTPIVKHVNLSIIIIER